jgi:hypothetical protein
MNLYFVSLLNEPRERKKNVTNLYFIPEPKSKLTKEYIFSRFPFLSKWDSLIVNLDLFFWNGKSFVHKEEIEVENNNPYFHGYWSNMVGLKLISEKDMKRISTSNFERKMLDNDRCLFLPKFKIGKVKYDLYFLLFSVDYFEEEEEFFLLEDKIRSLSGYYVKTELYKHKNTDLIKIQKRGLYLFFPV